MNRYITSILQKTLQKYIKTDQKDPKLDLSLWGGDVILTDIELNLQDELSSLPKCFILKKCFIKKLMINIPWSALTSQAITVNISGLNVTILCTNEFDSKTDSSNISISNEQDKGSKKDLSNNSTKTETTAQWMTDLLFKVLCNIKVNIADFTINFQFNNICNYISITGGCRTAAYDNNNWNISKYIELKGPWKLFFRKLEFNNLNISIYNSNTLSSDIILDNLDFELRCKIYLSKMINEEISILNIDPYMEFIECGPSLSMEIIFLSHMNIFISNNSILSILSMLKQYQLNWNLYQQQFNNKMEIIKDNHANNIKDNDEEDNSSSSWLNWFISGIVDNEFKEEMSNEMKEFKKKLNFINLNYIYIYIYIYHVLIYLYKMMKHVVYNLKILKYHY